MPPVGLFGRRALDLRRERGPRLLGLAPARMSLAHGAQRLVEAPVGIEQTALDRRIEQRLLLVLTVDLDQKPGQLAQQSGADGLIVDERARAPVGADQPPEHQRVLDGEAVGIEARRHVPIGGQGEYRGHRALRRAAADQRALGAAAERQAQSIQEDRLARAGLAGQHAQAALELEIEALDQDDVTDRETDQHVAARPDAPPANRRPTRGRPAHCVIPPFNST